MTTLFCPKIDGLDSVWFGKKQTQVRLGFGLGQNFYFLVHTKPEFALEG